LKIQLLIQETLEDAKRVIKSHKSKKDKQCNGQKKKDKQCNGQKKKECGSDSGLFNTTQKTIDRATRTPQTEDSQEG